MKTILSKALAGIAVAGSLLTGSAAMASESALNHIMSTGELKVCFEAGCIPFEMKAKNGNFVGFDIDLAKLMARAMQVKFVPVNTAWDGIIPALQTGKCDIIMGGMTITPLRNMKVMFSNAYLEIGQTVLLSKKLEGKIHSFHDLNNPQYTIVSQIGTTGAMAAKKYIPKAKLQLFETSADAALQVTNGKADAFVYDLPYNVLYAAQHKDSVYHLDKAFTYEPLGWAIRQDDPNFINFLNNYLLQIQKDGSYDRVYHKWFKSNDWLNNIQ